MGVVPGPLPKVMPVVKVRREEGGGIGEDGEGEGEEEEVVVAVVVVVVVVVVIVVGWKCPVVCD